MIVRCLTFNTWALKVGRVSLAPDIERRLSRTVEAIRQVKPDVIGLQEVWHPALAGRVAAELAPEWPHCIVDSNLSFSPLPLGSGLLLASRWPFISVDRLTFGTWSIWYERLIRKGAVSATAASPSGPLGVCVAHAAAVRESNGTPRERDCECRDAQIRRLFAWLEDRHRAVPSILLADLNADPAHAAGAALAELLSAGQRSDAACAGPLPPEHTFDPTTNALARHGRFKTLTPERVDLVLVGRATPVSYRRVFVDDDTVLGTPLSDHYGVLAEIEI